MAHGHWISPVAWHYTEMGHLVADAGKRDWDESQMRVHTDLQQLAETAHLEYNCLGVVQLYN
jgi:hypothetical protein